ncbi:hypothetical protein [Acetobacterium carbinolicum]|uniref:hypothetical protein n=1 Tax=Acetobacterium carbinolicum TaxID=52690 RepID=UPI0039C987CE
MTEKEFKERFPDVKKYKQSYVFEPIPVDSVEEVTDLERAEKLLSENWILINSYTNTQGFVVIFGRKC